MVLVIARWGAGPRERQPDDSDSWCIKVLVRGGKRHSRESLKRFRMPKNLVKNRHSDSLKKGQLTLSQVRWRREMMFLMIKMTDAWEQVSHKKEGQQHCEERNFSSGLNIFSSLHISNRSNVGGGGMSCQNYKLSHPNWVSHLPAGPLHAIYRVSDKWFFIQLFCDRGRWKKKQFLYYRWYNYIQRINLFAS